MATHSRNPLTARHQASPTPSPLYSSLRKLSSAKRARSPEPAPESTGQSSSKRAKALEPPATTTLSREEAKKEKERRRIDREQEFKVKYKRAFPLWTFHFDLDLLNPETAALRKALESRVTQLGARVDDFFSKDVTHLITSQPEETFANKENTSKSQQSHSVAGLLRSPIRLRGRPAKDATPLTAAEQLVTKALAFDIKVWSAAKLESVLNRCEAPPTAVLSKTTTSSSVHQLGAVASRERSLTRLLESERLHGTTERDPTQKRHDYIYFSKQSYFVLVEDMRQELATIAALEYPIQKTRDGQEKATWPVLHCHPRARGPFVEYDDKEERRREKADRADREREHERERRKTKLREEERRKKAQLHAKREGDLRRSVSMNNLHRRATMPNPQLEDFVDIDGDFGEGDVTLESANASGYLQSGAAYMAASGNSVSITSTTGTTSTTGNSFRTLQLPANLRGRLQQQVVTSRKFPPQNGKENGIMGPPPVPDRPLKMLRKSRSTNTMRLPKREEGTKPGYCECCRVKFEDFKSHVKGRRHQRFAADAANFVQLDYILSRVRRRTVEEAQAERGGWESQDYHATNNALVQTEDTAMTLPTVDVAAGEDVQWEDWVDAGEL